MRERLAAARLLVVFPFRVDAWRSSANLVLVLASQLAAVAVAVALKLATDAAAGHDFRRGVVAVVVLVVAMLLGTSGDWASFVLRTGISERTAAALDVELATLSSGTVGIEHLERPDYLDRVEHLRQSRNDLVVLPNQFALSLATVVRIAVSLYLVAEVQPLLALLPLFGLPALVATQHEHRLLSRIWDGKVGSLDRLQQAIRRLAGTEAGGRELRVFGMQEHIQQRYRDILDEADATWERVSVNCALVESAAWLLLGLAFTAALVILGRQALRGHLSPGDLVLVVTLVSQLGAQVVSLAGTTSALGGSLRTAERLVWLTRHATGDAERSRSGRRPPPAQLSGGIRLDGVGFTYPGTETEVLRDLDLLLPAGATVAVVGENGAGKTSLVKLLLRMYEPTNGSITVDGTDLRQLDVESWRRRSSASFQDDARFELSLERAVGIGRLDALDDPEAVMAALEAAQSLDVLQSLPHGLSTQLGRSFADGTELSGGQWQKVALARSMMRPDPLLLVLDEPTASLDPAVEAALFSRFTTAARSASRRSGAITVIVSHRFSTVRSADLIVVLAGGRVAEAGSHAELMARRGGYAELFELQAAGYR